MYVHTYCKWYCTYVCTIVKSTLYVCSYIRSIAHSHRRYPENLPHMPPLSGTNLCDFVQISGSFWSNTSVVSDWLHCLYASYIRASQCHLYPNYESCGWTKTNIVFVLLIHFVRFQNLSVMCCLDSVYSLLRPCLLYPMSTNITDGQWNLYINTAQWPGIAGF